MKGLPSLSSLATESRAWPRGDTGTADLEFAVTASLESERRDARGDRSRWADEQGERRSRPSPASDYTLSGNRDADVCGRSSTGEQTVTVRITGDRTTRWTQPNEDADGNAEQPDERGAAESANAVATRR